MKPTLNLAIERLRSHKGIAEKRNNTEAADDYEYAIVILGTQQAHDKVEAAKETVRLLEAK